jgi:hypothetical protein
VVSTHYASAGLPALGLGPAVLVPAAAAAETLVSRRRRLGAMLRLGEQWATTTRGRIRSRCT